MNIKNNNKGFSLIELSIVLIIIGLLVSGITGGASLIKSAELRSIMTEARGYKMAVNAYYTSQDELPGDDNNSDVGNSVEGDVNGKIEMGGGKLVAEGLEAWNDMADDSISILDRAMQTPVTPTATTIPAIATTLMGDSKYKGAGWVFDYLTTPELGGTTTGGGNEAVINSNSLIFTSKTFLAGTEVEPGAVLTGLQISSIDKKMDDGAILTGSVIGLNGYSAANTEVICTNTATTDLCSIAFKIDL